MNSFKQLFVCGTVCLCCLTVKTYAEPISLVPDTPSKAPDYYCTWNLQGFVSHHAFGPGSDDARAEMNEDNLFGTHKVYAANVTKNIDGAEYFVDSIYQGWLDHYPSIRGDLMFVIDDSWDIPFDSNSKRPHGVNYDNEYLSTLALDETRFPSFTGTDVERLRKLVEAVKEKGWKGLGGWICTQDPICFTRQYTGKTNTYENSLKWSVKQEEKYWKRRLAESQEAGLSYWKVDWGNKCRDDEFQENISIWGQEVAPDLIIEHGSFQDGGLHRPYYVNFCKVIRTYDVRPDLSQAQTIARIAEVLESGRAAKEGWGIINCEDEAYIAAGLGCSIGIMRHPYTGPLPGLDGDETFDAGTRMMKNRLNEIVRAVRWHRIAEPFSSDGQFRVSSEELYDSGPYRSYKAPASVSRRLPLPEILGIDKFNEAKPYVLASLYDNGCTALAIINRNISGVYQKEKVDVRVEPKFHGKKVGIFGYCHSVTLSYQDGLPEGEFEVLAQDLAYDGAAESIPYMLTEDGRGIIISGKTIEMLCRGHDYTYSEVSHIDADHSDISDPAIVLLVVAGAGHDSTTRHF